MNIRDEILTIEEWKLLMTRTNSNLDASTKVSFNKAIHLFATNDDVHNHNKCCLISLNQPVSRSVVTRSNNNDTIEEAEENLDNGLLLAIGDRVMLT